MKAITTTIPAFDKPIVSMIGHCSPYTINVYSDRVHLCYHQEPVARAAITAKGLDEAIATALRRRAVELIFNKPLEVAVLHRFTTKHYELDTSLLDYVEAFDDILKATGDDCRAIDVNLEAEVELRAENRSVFVMRLMQNGELVNRDGTPYQCELAQVILNKA